MAMQTPANLPERFPRDTSGNLRLLEFVRDEIHYAAEAKRQQLARGYSNDTLERMIRGVYWTEAKVRLELLTELPLDLRNQVDRILSRELAIGTIEQIDNLLSPVITALRNAWEDARNPSNPSNQSAQSLVNTVSPIDSDPNLRSLDITGTSEKRFAVALSFAGENRSFIGGVAEHLAAVVGRQRVLYDKWYEAEFARPRLATYLQPLYHDQSELVVVFICANYERKEWCGLEWDAVLDLIKTRQDDRIMLVRFDNTEIVGLYSTHGYVWVEDRPPEVIGELILERWQQVQKGEGTASATQMTVTEDCRSRP